MKTQREKDKVSIILPYYKKKFFFEKSIKSALSQTYKNKEIIIIYDDRNREELKFIKKKIYKIKDVKIIVNSENFGVSKSRNIGINKARGKYIAFLDCDDIWIKKKLEIQVKLMKKKKISFLHSNYLIINKSDHLIGKMKIKKELSYKDLLESCDVGLSTVILEKKILPKKPFPENLKTKEDFVLWLKISKRHKIIGINKFLTKWRKLENSLSSDVFQKIKDAFKVFYIYEKNNIFISSYYTIRLIFYAVIKKIFWQKIY